jgi:hypothetical protein
MSEHWIDPDTGEECVATRDGAVHVPEGICTAEILDRFEIEERILAYVKRHELAEMTEMELKSWVTGYMAGQAHTLPDEEEG